VPVRRAVPSVLHPPLPWRICKSRSMPLVGQSDAVSILWNRVVGWDAAVDSPSQVPAGTARDLGAAPTGRRGYRSARGPAGSRRFSLRDPRGGGLATETRGAAGSRPAPCPDATLTRLPPAAPRAAHTVGADLRAERRSPSRVRPPAAAGN
jgi:hypothetical protein